MVWDKDRTLTDAEIADLLRQREKEKQVAAQQAQKLIDAVNSSGNITTQLAP